MPEPAAYGSHLSLAAAAFVAGLPKRKQRTVLELAEQIARQPFRIGDYQATDSAGRTVENLLLHGFIFTYWVDHAAREVRIAEILKV